MRNYQESADFYRELSIKCNNELKNLLEQKKQKDEEKLKAANTISVASFVLMIVGIVCAVIHLIPIGVLIIPIIGIIYGIASTPSRGDIDKEYWDKKIEIINRYLNAWQRSAYYCDLPYQYIRDFREISIEFMADISGLRFKPSHKLY